MRKIATNDDLMTTRQAGEALGVAVRTVQLWVESGVLPAWRTAGGHRRIARSAVEKLMTERAQVIAQPGGRSGKEDRHAAAPVLKMLFVEDDPNQSHLFAMMVAQWDFPVAFTSAANGFEGLLRIGQLRPDMVVTDLNMPGMDGFQMVRSLMKSGSGFEGLAIIVVTSFDKGEIEERGGLPDGAMVFQKPIPFPAIEALCRDVQARLAGAAMPV